jgi:hypothetical protein
MLFLTMSSSLTRFSLEPTIQGDMINMYLEVGRLQGFGQPYIEYFLEGLGKVICQISSIKETQIVPLVDLLGKLLSAVSIEDFSSWPDSDMQTQDLVARTTTKLVGCCTKYLVSQHGPIRKTTGPKGKISESDLCKVITTISNEHDFDNMESCSESDDEAAKSQVERVTGSQKYFSDEFSEFFSNFLQQMFRRSISLISKALQMTGDRLFEENSFTTSLSHCCSAYMGLLQASIGCMSFFDNLAKDLLCNSDSLYQFVTQISKPKAFHIKKLISDPLGLLQDMQDMDVTEKCYTSSIQIQAGRLLNSDNMILMGLNSCFITWAIREIQLTVSSPGIGNLAGPLVVIGHCASRLKDSESRIIHILVTCIQYVIHLIEKHQDAPKSPSIIENVCYLLHFIKLHIKQIFKWLEKTNLTLQVHNSSGDNSKLAVDSGEGFSMESAQQNHQVGVSSNRLHTGDKIPEFVQLKMLLNNNISRFLQLTTNQKFENSAIAIWCSDTLSTIIKCGIADKGVKEFFGQLMLPILTKILKHQKFRNQEADWDIAALLDAVLQTAGMETQPIRSIIFENLEEIFNRFFINKQRNSYGRESKSHFPMKNGRSYTSESEYSAKEDYFMHRGYDSHQQGDTSQLLNLLSQLVPICVNERNSMKVRHPKDVGLEGVHAEAAAASLKKLIILFNNKLDQQHLVVLGDLVYPLVRFQIDLLQGVSEEALLFMERSAQKSSGRYRAIEDKEFELIVTILSATLSPRTPQFLQESALQRLQQVQTELVKQCMRYIGQKDVIKSSTSVLCMMALQRLVLTHAQSMPIQMMFELVSNLTSLMNSESIMKGYHTASLGLVSTVKLVLNSQTADTPEKLQLHNQTNLLLQTLIQRMVQSPLSYLSNTRTIKFLGLVALQDGQLMFALQLANLIYLKESPCNDEDRRAKDLAYAYKNLQNLLKDSISNSHQVNYMHPPEIFEEDEDDQIERYQDADFNRPWRAGGSGASFTLDQLPERKEIHDLINNASKLLEWTDTSELDLFEAIRSSLSATRGNPEAIAAARQVLEGYPLSTFLLRVHRMQRDFYLTEYVRVYRVKRVSSMVILTNN